MTTIVCIHGRGQEGKNPKALLDEWRTALCAGLGTPALAAPAVMAYYGNVLAKAVAQAAKRADVLAELPADTEEMPFHPFMPEDVGELERRLVADMAMSTAAISGAATMMFGIEDVLSWALARQLLGWVSRHTSVDKEIIKVFLQDVAVYLTHGRRPVLDEVRRFLPASGPIILLTHSLGTVVGRDLLVDEAVRRRVTLWVTAGSPLGLPTIQRNLLAKGTRHPGVNWLTTYDVNDVVAIGHPLDGAWGTPLSQVEVENDDAPHDIARYLRHGSVAGPVGRACR